MPCAKKSGFEILYVLERGCPGRSLCLLGLEKQFAGSGDVLQRVVLLCKEWLRSREWLLSKLLRRSLWKGYLLCKE